MEWAELAKSALALFAIVDPVGMIPMFLLATQGYTAAQSRRACNVATLTVLVVLVAFLLAGQSVLDFFGIRLASFSIAGGILLLMLGLSMVSAQTSPQRQTAEERVEAEEKEAVGVVPLGVPLLAGPGAITHVIVASGSTAHTVVNQGLLVLPIVAVAATVWLSFRAAPWIAGRLGQTGIHVVTRLMGLVIAAISVEMIARGLVGLFPKLAG